MEDIQTETGYEGEGVGEELNDLKKEMAERIVDKMWENNDLLLLFGKGITVDYLVDEGGADSLGDALIEKIGIDNFEGYAQQLKDLREEISKVVSKQEIANLEDRIIKNLENGSNIGAEPGDSEGETVEQTTTSTSIVSSSTPVIATSTSVREDSSENHGSETEISVDSANVGEAKEVPLDQRMQWLFPEGVPQTEKQMKKYIEKIKVPIRTSEGKSKKLTLHVHKKLSNEYKSIFQEMYDKGIPVNPEKTACFNRRKMRKGKKMSHHSYGTALDINWDVNGGVYGKTDKNSLYYNNQATVNIRKNHGFYWGGDWSSRSNDPMHFTYMNA